MLRLVQCEVGGHLFASFLQTMVMPKMEEGSSALRIVGKGYDYRIPNGPGTIGGTRHDPKKHDPSLALGTINRV
jgi:hypothetical protein